jgi:NADH:ubiquinone oxidoreductase subunit 6 (subunit J)
MFILFLVLFILLLLFNIYFLIKSLKPKDNKNWVILFSLNISSIISALSIGYYSLATAKGLNYLILIVLELCIYVIALIVNFILKTITMKRNKDQNVIEKLNKTTIIKSIILPLVLVAFLTIIICGIDYSKSALQKKEELNTYNNIKNSEISKMADFLNNKYDMNLSESDCIYYHEENYTISWDLDSGNVSKNIPYIAVFRTDNENITVSDRTGFISDNKQLKDLNKFISDYYQEKTGIKFDYIEFSKSYSWTGDDNIINTVLQTKFNKLITNQNVEELIKYILQESDLSIKFYIKDDENTNKETLINSITNKLDYLKDYSNIDVLTVYGYDDNLIIKNEGIDFSDYESLKDDYYDGYKFGYYYIDSDSINVTFSLSMDLDRGYTTSGELINGWRYSASN